MGGLYLSHWESEKDVYVQECHIRDMKSYHISSIRSLYETYNRKFNGKLLTYKDGINPVVILRGFLSAMLKDIAYPILILCEYESIRLWNYEMNKLCSVNICDSTNKIEDESVMICSYQKLKDFREIVDSNWSIVIAEDIENVVNKLVFKRIKNVQFKIALSKKDFTDSEDLKVFWNVLNWCNPLLFGKLHDFEQFHKEHYDNLRDPYYEIWHRIDWDLTEGDLKNLENEDEEYNKLITKQTKETYIKTKSVSKASKTNVKASGVKRKFENNPSTSQEKMNKSKMEKSQSKLIESKSISILNTADYFKMKNENYTNKRLINVEDKIEVKRPKSIDEVVNDTETPEAKTEEFPIIDAIINGSSLKKAVEKYRYNVLGVSDDREDQLYSISSRKETADTSENSSQQSSQKEDLLTFLFGNQAAVLTRHKSVIFHD